MDVRSGAVRRLATIALAILPGAVASLLLALVASSDLGHPLPDGAGSVIGARGHGRAVVDRFWRPFAPKAWQAWPGAARVNDPAAEVGRTVGILIGDRWVAYVVHGAGLFDTVWIESSKGPRDCWAYRRDEALRKLEELERRGHARDATSVEAAPPWIPTAFSRECRGFLPDTTLRIAAQMLHHPRPDFHSELPGAPDDAKARESASFECVDRVDEARLFGWPLRCFVVHGSRVDRRPADLMDDHEPTPPQHWSDGIGAEVVTDPLAFQFELLPATGLPWKPLWLPFLANSLILGVPLTLAGVGVSRTVRWGIARIRGKGDKCPRCGYARKGLAPGAACPECGEARVGV